MNGKRHRINIIGASGSGTTTLGRAVAEALSVPHFDADDYFHMPSDPPFQKQYSPEDRYHLLERDLQPTSSWVLSGGVVEWQPLPELRLSCVVLLRVPTDVRIRRLKSRELDRFGTRIEPGGDMYDLHREFLSWTTRYEHGDLPGKTFEKHDAFLRAQSCPTLRFSGVHDVDDMVYEILHAVRQPNER